MRSVTQTERILEAGREGHKEGRGAQRGERGNTDVGGEERGVAK